MKTKAMESSPMPRPRRKQGPATRPQFRRLRRIIRELNVIASETWNRRRKAWRDSGQSNDSMVPAMTEEQLTQLRDALYWPLHELSLDYFEE